MNWTKVVAKMKSEFQRASKKHPRVMDQFSNRNAMCVESELKETQDVNDWYEQNGKAVFTKILREECLEAELAALKHDPDNCIEELTHVIVVALRGIDHVMKHGI